MDWSKGYSASFYATLVDPRTWRSTERIEIMGGSISRSVSMLMESADIECRRYPAGIEKWIRIFMDVRQGGSSAHVALFTGLATSPSRDIDGNRVSHSVECYSVLKPAADVLLPRGWYALAGQNGGALIESLLGVTPAPIVVEDASPALSESIVAEDGESRLSMAEKILLAINWRLRIGGDGTITVCPQATEASARFGETASDSIEPKLSTSEDWFPVPNVFRAVIGDLSETATDDSPTSQLSTVTRGREIWAEELSPTLADNESLASYAGRRLRALQMVASTASYDRRYNPDVYVGDLVALSYPKQGLDGTYEVTSQKIELGYNARTSEEVSMVLSGLATEETEVDYGYLLDSDGDYLVDADGDSLIYIAVS